VTWAVCVSVTLAACESGPRSAPSPTPTPSATPPPSLSAAPAPPPAPSAAASAAPPTVTFDADTLGKPPAAFDVALGSWVVAERDGVRGVEVDGSKTPGRSDDFFPLAAWKGSPPGDFRASVRFFPIDGKIDQAAGIAFGIAADGSYLGVRANALENNLLFFRVVQGKRTVLQTIGGVATATRTWHTLSLDVRGRFLQVALDGQRRFERPLDAAPSGRIGLWSKADSHVLMTDFRVEAVR
jgi:hypothetical protein